MAEKLHISKDDIVVLDHAQRQTPDPIAVHAAATTILLTLSRLLETSLAMLKLEDCHCSSGERSPDVTRLLRYHALSL